jgi:hypothetical protein
MQLSYGNCLILFVVSVSVAFSIVLFWKAPKNSPNRTSFLWKFILLAGVAFSSGLVLLIVFLPQSWLNIVSWVVFDFLVSYVFCVEIPAYLRILKFDRKAAKALEDLREELIRMRYSFAGSLENLKKMAQGNVGILEEESISGLLNNFIVVCDRLRNLDLSLWSLALTETSSTINEIKGRSKHPFPKLVDLLSLSGLSILLAQFLQLFK